MRFYTRTHKHYCGVDLHARSMYICIVNQERDVLLHRNLRCDPTIFLSAIRPYREDLVVGVECIFNWYWLADLCAKEKRAVAPDERRGISVVLFQLLVGLRRPYTILLKAKPSRRIPFGYEGSAVCRWPRLG